MKKRPLAFLSALLLFSTGVPSAAATERIFDGSYQSGYQNHPQRLRAVFTPYEEEGDDAWRVSFDFTYGKNFYTYSGWARGSFEDGEIGGRVENESGARTFTFLLQKNDKGRFDGTHAEVFGGSEEPTGTLTLKEKQKKEKKKKKNPKEDTPNAPRRLR